MTGDLRDDLVRAARHYPPPEDAFERLEHRLDRARRGERVGALVVGLAVSVAAVGLAVLAFRGGDEGGVSSNAGTQRNGDLLYSKATDDGWHLFAADPLTGEERMLTDGVRDYGSDWSPDSTKIVYDTDAGKIVIANANGSAPTVVASGSYPTWSPDGTRIAYSGTGGGIWIVDVDGSDAHQVTDGPETDYDIDANAAWSPDGRSIAYTRVVAHRSPPTPNGSGMTTDVSREELRVWHEGTDPADVLLTDDYAGLGDVDWSPDGSTLVFTGGPTLFGEQETDGIVHAELLLIPSGGGEVTSVVSDGLRDASAATWSPDGALLAFVHNDRTMVVIRPDGTDRHALPIDPGDDSIVDTSWGGLPAGGER